MFLSFFAVHLKCQKRKSLILFRVNLCYLLFAIEGFQFFLFLICYF